METPTTPRLLDRMELVEHKLLENGRMPVSKAMLEAGYSPNFSKQPNRLKESKKWQRIMKKYLPDKKLGEKHQQLLNSSKLNHYVFPTSTPDKDIKSLIESIDGAKFIKIQGSGNQWKRAYFTVSDNETQTKNLELAYKIKGKMSGSSEPTSGVVGEEVREVIFRVRKLFPDSTV